MTSKDDRSADGRRLAKVLRHRGDLEHDIEGWFPVDTVLAELRWDCERLEQEVARNTRYQLSQDGRTVRALHGHSFPVEYESAQPPDTLFHGTSSAGLEAIQDSGSILPMGRHMVHLSDDPDKAIGVGRRHGEAIALVIDASRMHREGFRFYRSADGVYLVGSVPLEFVVDQIERRRACNKPLFERLSDLLAGSASSILASD
ncbi:MAG: RNA 2'-phosphotransferase [Candidatus Methanomethylophilaceae archaeon]|nr:RNA 2'-phosphotransferase [Candidatus Methanomethylophilaceae archaeon]